MPCYGLKHQSANSRQTRTRTYGILCEDLQVKWTGTPLYVQVTTKKLGPRITSKDNFRVATIHPESSLILLVNLV
jgi:hypothetical protein